MSLGQGGRGEKVDEDDNYILYGYGCYSYNEPSKCDCVLDGFFLVNKQFFLRSKKEKAVETSQESQARFLKYVYFENCSHCFKVISPFGMDAFSYYLIRKLEKMLLEGKEFPQEVNVYQ